MELSCCNCGETKDIEEMVFNEETKEWLCIGCAKVVDENQTERI